MKRVYFLLILICFFSCQKERSSEVGKTSPSLVDVYVAGWESDDAIYWKNGNPVILQPGSGVEIAWSIFVSGNDVYVAGDRFTPGTDINGYPNRIAKYWKNGTPVNLTDGLSVARALSITVFGNDVYVAGKAGRRAVYWKNGNPIYLTDGSGDAQASSIYLDGQDIYVAGDESKDTLVAGQAMLRINHAICWKNGDPVILTTTGAYVGVKSIFLIGDDVYVGASLPHNVEYWKNGEPVNVGYGFASCFIASGDDIYVSGQISTGGQFTSKTFPVYWKNNDQINLSDDSDTSQATATSIAVSGTDVYVAGVKFIDGPSAYMAKYWKNGLSVNLGDSITQSGANAIFVVAH